jgi:hypothetical protein
MDGAAVALNDPVQALHIYASVNGIVHRRVGVDWHI